MVISQVTYLKYCDGFWRDLSVSTKFGDLSDFAYALIGVSNERTTQPHSRDGSEIGKVYFNKLIILPKTSRFVFYAYLNSSREYV